MSGGQGSRWGTIRNIRTVLRSSQVRDEGQPRGWERQRDDVRPPASNPPPPSSRPPYGNSQHYPSDPGPHSGHGPWQNSPHPLPQDSPPSLYNQGQYQAGSNPQGYGPPPPSDRYQPTFSQTYGQNQGHFGHPPPASYSPYNPTYQQQPMSSTGQSYQAGQGGYPASQAAYQPAGNSYSPPLQGPGLNPNFAGPSYPTHSNGGSMTRTVTAPAILNCEHRDPGNGFCPACDYMYRYNSGR